MDEAIRAYLVDSFATLNYSKNKRIDAVCVEQLLESKGYLVPVTTEASRRDRARLPSTGMANLPP
jgi:hypothetical protein